MRNINKKIGFFYLSQDNCDSELVIEDELRFLLNYITRQSRVFKKFNISKNKFCFLDSAEFDESRGLLKLLFKSAKHDYRAPLIDKTTVEERDNPKTMNEGERKKTHLLIKFINGDAIVFLETGQNALSLKQITDYFNNYINVYNSSHSRNQIQGRYVFSIIPRDDFREVLDSMSRVVLAEIFIEKQILGSDTLNLSNRLDNVQEDIVIQVRAEKNKSIKQAIYDFLVQLNGGSVISKLKVKGKMENKNEVIIDTSFINKKEYVQAQQDLETGEINTPYMFSQLIELSESFN